MKKINIDICYLLLCVLAAFMASCLGKSNFPDTVAINAIHLKRGEVISCGPADGQFGSLNFEITSIEKVKADFNLAIKLLHSFEYDEAEKVFARIIDAQPDCAMAFWGVAMSNFHALWTPPSEVELRKGSQAIAIAKSIHNKTSRESAYINAIADFYKDWEKVEHMTRCINFEKSMEQLYVTYKDDKEAAIFYALALNAAADPADKTFVKQKKAGTILNSLYPGEPNHPGIVHYIIHTYDSPELAPLALPAARKYATVAPSSAHALHMPSHIFTRLGSWDECIQSNLASVSAAQCYAEATGIKGHWDEELHGLDYLVYAYLQKGDNANAKKQVDYLKTIEKVQPSNFKVAYAFAAIPSRYVLENKLWQEAAILPIEKKNFQWQHFLWQKAIIHFTRLMGSVQIGKINAAKTELQELKTIHKGLLDQKDLYKANQVHIQEKTGDAWIQWKDGKADEALLLMKEAVAMEDKTDKHPVTPSEVIPAIEFLGDMLLQMNQPTKALEAYETELKKHPNRFNALYGAGLSAEKSGNKKKSDIYYSQLLEIANTGNTTRAELKRIKSLPRQL